MYLYQRYVCRLLRNKWRRRDISGGPSGVGLLYRMRLLAVALLHDILLLPVPLYCRGLVRHCIVWNRPRPCSFL